MKFKRVREEMRINNAKNIKLRGVQCRWSLLIKAEHKFLASALDSPTKIGGYLSKGEERNLHDSAPIGPVNSETQISSVLVKPVSADCNLSCTYCFYLPKSELYPETKVHRMSDNVLRNLIAQMLSLAPEKVSFCWQGGEPTLAGLNFYKKAIRYQLLFKAPFQIVENSIQTNGILINEEWAKFLAGYDFLVGVSLDGPQEIHDYYRKRRGGSGSYKDVIRCLNTLSRHHVKFNILTVLNARNVRDPRGLYKFLTDRGFRYLQFIPCVEKRNGRIADFSITPEEYGEFLCEVFDEWFNDGAPNTYVRDFEDILISYVTGDTPNCVFGRTCGRYVVVEYNGDVYPCDFYVERKWFLGNIMHEPIEDIIRKRKFMEFKNRKIELTKKCRGCKWLRYCNGGCPRHWEILDFTQNYFCESYKTFFEYSHERFMKLKNRISPTFYFR